MQDDMHWMAAVMLSRGCTGAADVGKGTLELSYVLRQNGQVP